MSDSGRESNDERSSPSEHSPPPEQEEHQAQQRDDIGESDSVDPAQDALVGNKSLDDRFNDDQLRELILRKDEYRCASAKQRKELAFKTGETLVKDMLRNGVKMSEDERGIFMENVKLWFAQRARTRKEPIQWSIHWSGRQVLYREQPARIKGTQKALYEAHTGKRADEDEMGLPDIEDVEETVEMPKDKPPKPFHFFQKALSIEWESLSRKEQDEYEEKARVWRSLGPEEAERRRMAERHAARTIREFAHNLYRQMGVRFFMLASWEDNDGRIISVPLDFNHELGSDGQSYKVEHRAYLESIGLLQHYASFSQKIWPDKDAVVDRDASPKDITFAVTPEGRAILPDPSLPHPILKPFRYLPNLVRKFVDADYALSRGIPVNRKSGRGVPWGSLKERLSDFVKPEYLPVGWTSLCDPGALGVENCRLLLNHWWKRQQEHLVPFAFHQWEIVPPELSEDGVTQKTPAVMAPRELLPLPADMSAESDAPKTQKAKRNRKPRKKKDPVSRLASRRPASKVRDTPVGTSSKASHSRSKPARSESEKRMVESPADTPSDGDNEELPDQSDNPELSTQGRTSRERPGTHSLINATKELSLRTPTQSRSPIPPPESDRQQTRDKGKESMKLELSGETEETEMEDAEADPRSKKGKGPVAHSDRSSSPTKKVKASTATKLAKKVQWRDGGLNDGPDMENVVGEVEEEVGDGDGNVDMDRGKNRGGRGRGRPSKRGRSTPVVREASSRSQRSRSKSVSLPVPEDMDDEEVADTIPTPTLKGEGSRKISAEDRALLEVANSSQYRVTSPKRKRTARSQYGGDV
ncbi:hypothetical protein NMY22_g7427 [Coprinellus aureogranulatus]|nr:hypothetical protein NMY22_g7427 [Coprinellus aureogranulatus]